MFGHQDDQQDTNHISEQAIEEVISTETSSDATTPASDTAAPLITPGQPWQHPGAPIGVMPAAVADDSPSADTDAPQVVTPLPPPTDDDAEAIDDSTNDLIDIKQKALSQLSPLVGHLDQTPEEKFRTTMMMIQASDDKTMVKPAYEAAQAITDEKVRAQALLDIVNEINYFTQHQQS